MEPDELNAQQEMQGMFQKLLGGNVWVLGSGEVLQGVMNGLNEAMPPVEIFDGLTGQKTELKGNTALNETVTPNVTMNSPGGLG